MKRILLAVLAVTVLLGTLSALAVPVEKETLSFELYTGENNQCLYIAELEKEVTGLTVTIENEKGTKILSKNKCTQKEEGGKRWLCVLVSPKKAGKCSYEYHYSYYDEKNIFREYYYPVTIRFRDPPGPPEITKHPSGETVAEGGSCTFVARADDADTILWFLTNGHDTIKASKGPSRFAGLKVSGEESEKLKLSNIPTSLDGWEAFAMFTNANGSTDSKSADINVYRAMTEVTEVPYIVCTTAAPAPTPTPIVTPDPYTGKTAAATPAPTPYNGTKLCASAIEIKNVAGRAVGLSDQEAQRVTGYLGGTYVLTDDGKDTLWYTNAYGTFTATITETAGTEAAVTDEVTKTYTLTWTETPKVLSDHTVSASKLEITEQYGFITAVKLSFGFDGRTDTQPFDSEKHASGWRYSAEETFDIPIA